MAKAKAKRATEGERIVADVRYHLINRLPVSDKVLAIGINRAIARAVKAERFRCVCIVSAARDKNMHSGRGAPFVCDDIMRCIATTPKAAPGKQGNRKEVRGG